MEPKSSKIIPMTAQKDYYTRTPHVNDKRCGEKTDWLLNKMEQRVAELDGLFSRGLLNKRSNKSIQRTIGYGDGVQET